MKLLHSRSFAAAITGVLLIMPALASAQSTDTSVQVQALLAQIKALQEQLKTIMMQMHSNDGGGDMASSTSHGGMKGRCLDLVRDLKKGAQGDDVTNLQQTLADDHDVFPEGSITGFFGPATERAVKRFQQKFGIASTSTGFVGPKTREAMRGRCGRMMGGKDGMMSSTSRPWEDRLMGSSSDPWLNALQEHVMHNDNDGMKATETRPQMGSIVPRMEAMMEHLVGSSTEMHETHMEGGHGPNEGPRHN